MTNDSKQRGFNMIKVRFITKDELETWFSLETQRETRNVSVGHGCHPPTSHDKVP